MSSPETTDPGVQVPAVPPVRSRRVRVWILLTLISVILSVVVFGWTVFVRQRELAKDVINHSGNVGWFQRFGGIPVIGGIQSIGFPNGGVDDQWVQATRWTDVPSLQTLSLKGCHLSDSSLPALLALDRLQELDLERSAQLTPEALSQLRQLPRLQRLNLDVEILGDGKAAIPHLAKLTQLKELNFYGYKTDPPGLGELNRALPGTRIQIIDPTASSMAIRPIPPSARVKVLFQPGGHKLAVGDGEGIVRVYDLTSQTLDWTEKAHEEWLFGLAFDPTGQILATAGGDGEIRLWDMERRAPVAALTGHGDDVHAIAFSPDGRRLLSSSDDMTVRSWDVPPLDELRATGTLNSYRPSATWTDHEDTIPTLTVSSDGQWLASGSRDGTVQLRNLESGQAMVQLLHSIHRRPRDERGLSVGAFDPHRPRGDVMGVAFDAQSRLLATTGYDGQIRLWNVPTGEIVSQWPAHEGWAFGVMFLPQGDLVSWGRKGRISIWNPEGQRMRDLWADDDVASVAVSPDGSRLAACTASGQLKIWALADLNEDGRLLP